MSLNTQTTINTPVSTGVFTPYFSLDHQSTITQKAASKIQAVWRGFILRRDLPSNSNNSVNRNLYAEFEKVKQQQASTDSQFPEFDLDFPARKNRIESSAPESSLPNLNSNKSSVLLKICQCALISLGIISIYYVQKKL